MATILVYRIVDWDKHFENNRTRDMANMRWVPIPNKYDGDGYTQLLDHKNGEAHYGCWVSIVGIASRCEPRGTLLRTGPGSSPQAHNAKSLARMTRMKESLMTEALPRFISIGWMDTYEIPQEGAERVAPIPQEGAEKPQARATEWKEGMEGKELNGMEDSHAGKPRGGNQWTMLWDEVYGATYPGKVYPWMKKDAIALAGAAKTLGGDIDSLRRAIERYFKSADKFYAGHPVGKFVSSIAQFTDAAVQDTESEFDRAWRLSHG